VNPPERFPGSHPGLPSVQERPSRVCGHRERNRIRTAQLPPRENVMPCGHPRISRRRPEGTVALLDSKTFLRGAEPGEGRSVEGYKKKQVLPSLLRMFFVYLSVGSQTSKDISESVFALHGSKSGKLRGCNGKTLRSAMILLTVILCAVLHIGRVWSSVVSIPQGIPEPRTGGRKAPHFCCCFLTLGAGGFENP